MLITSTYQSSHSELLEEWSSLMAATSKNMLGRLSRNAAIYLEEVTYEIRKLKDLFNKHSSKEEIKQFMAEMEKRPSKYEEEIEAKKKRKFLRDKINYTTGRILTFRYTQAQGPV
ncbi:hypothetical protein NDU88_003907 [Pleurodeles waltl]|uniref:Uncharacterized protein n=1 Tax=Pleurodeles waltl TaxID=8319 RepID=A0AAV7T6P2_PLEWA|nr:hypothetical protein NDU88_003907 [Pleurodeles waltl]